MSTKQHIGIVIVGHVDAGKSTTTGRLLFELGGIKERDLEKLRDEARANGKVGFEFAYLMDKSKEERTRGVTIQCATKEFFTDKYHYTIIDAPGHRDFIKNMISGASQADVALLMVPAELGGFEKAIAKGNHKKGEVQGQTRQHARLCFLLGITQMIVGINKMDTIKWNQERYDEVQTEMGRMLDSIGYKQRRIPFIPISGFNGDNVTTKSDKAPWYKGFKVPVSKTENVEGYTLLEALNTVVRPPKRDSTKPFRMSVSGVYKIPGVGDVITGRIEQGKLVPDTEVLFTPSRVPGKVFSIEMHHKKVPEANPGDNVGLNVKGLKRDNMPKVGDTMFIPKEGAVRRVASFKAQVFVQEHPGELKPASEGKGGFTPSVHVRCGRAPCQLQTLHWKMGKDTGGSKQENPACLKAGDQAEVTFTPKMDMHAEAFADCPGLGRIAVMDSNSLVMLGKILSVEYKD